MMKLNQRKKQNFYQVMMMNKYKKQFQKNVFFKINEIKSRRGLKKRDTKLPIKNKNKVGQKSLLNLLNEHKIKKNKSKTKNSLDI